MQSRSMSEISFIVSVIADAGHQITCKWVPLGKRRLPLEKKKMQRLIMLSMENLKTFYFTRTSTIIVIDTRRVW